MRKDITLELNGREIEFKLGLGFIGEVIEETGLDLFSLDAALTKNPFKYIPWLMYISARFGLEYNGKEVDFTLYDFVTWIDEDGGVGSKTVTRFIEAFTKSLNYGVPVAKKGEKVKKK